MSGDVEHSDRRTHPDFPPHWGLPQGRQFSDERRQWILGHVVADQEAELRAFRNGDPEARARISRRLDSADLASRDPRRLLAAVRRMARR